MSDALDDWEQADEVEIHAPVAAASGPVKKIVILPLPSTGSPGSSGAPGRGIGRGGGSPMILKRNPGSNSSSGGGASQQGISPSGQGSPTPPFGREISPFNDSSYSNNGQRPSMGTGYREEDPDLVGENTLRRQMDGLSLRDRNRVLWDQANAYEQPIIARADTTRTEYVPEIRILRRPKSPVQTVRVSNQVKSKPLAQREADYNAAREKIFGPSPTATPSLPSPSPNSPNNNNNDITPGSRTHSGGARSPRRHSPSVGGGGGSSSSPNSRPTSRPSSRSASPSQPHQTVQIYTGSSSNSGAFESALENVKPIEFRGGPPPSRRGGGNSGSAGGRGSGQEGVNTAIRQPLGPMSTMASGGYDGGSKSRGRGRGRGTGGGRDHRQEVQKEVQQEI
ncbi:hypothetical protein BG015_010050 [Linnemannia schmuckeri]|uniref:SUZ domain-containing protein n=1 Tax=Linnemannia schmuckeri TaxID=64567 RepID=A0A9P5V9H9_9FUNG|nr:hypothetical protein BG015_010050 [Linnemannia schmuckeri]